MKTLTCFLLFALLHFTTSQSVKFYVIRHWKYINFTWPDEDTLKTATATGSYIPENIVISGVKYYDDYYYLTSPRMKPGVPATLTRIKAGQGQSVSPNLEPFPSWEMNGLNDCNNLQNVQNVEIDSRGQMWIIDGGRVQTLMDPVVKCSPKLLIYDIKEKRINTVYQFPEDIAGKNGSFLYDLVVDNTDGGFAYITDNSAHDPGIIVYSVKENRSWKIRDTRSMNADPSAIRFSVNDTTINTPINIAGIALGPKIHTSSSKVVINEDREVYYCPLSSLHLYSLNTSTLRNENLSRGTTTLENSVKDIGVKGSQTVGMVMDNQGILYYNLLGMNAVGRWDSHTPFQDGQRLIARDKTYLEWPNSFTFDKNGNLTVLMNRLNKFIFSKIDLNQYNFRLISAFVGGQSYLQDEKFNYEPSSTPEPLPSPEPHPEPNGDHDHMNHDHMNHDHMGSDDAYMHPDLNRTNQGHVMASTTDSTDNVIITKGSGSRFVISLLALGLGTFVAFV